MACTKTALSFLLLLFLGVGSCNSRQVQNEPVQTQREQTGPYTTKTPHRDGIGKVYLGREISGIMGAGGGSWLERSNREQEEQVTQAIAGMGLRPESVVADIGAGTGYYTFRMAAQVPEGKVYAVEVQDTFISSLEKRKQELNQQNVEVVKGSSQGINVPDASLDLAIMVDVYHELEYPKEMLQAIHKALKPDGKLLLLEYRAEDPAIPIKELHKMSVEQANKELEANGFRLFKKEDLLPIQHFLLFEKAGK